MKSPDVRWKQRFYNFKKAFSQFEKGVTLALSRNLSELEDQGLIKTFEQTARAFSLL